MFANNHESLSLHSNIIAFMWLQFLFVFSSICGLRDAGILNDLGRSNYKDSKAHLSEDNLVRFLALANGLASKHK